MRQKLYPAYKDAGVGWIGSIPIHWTVKPIKHLSTVRRGASPRPIDDPKYFSEEGEFAWVRIADVTSSHDYLETTVQKLSKLGSSLSVKLHPGSLFISIAGTVGKPCITRIKACIHDGFVYFPNLSQDPRFLLYIFLAGRAFAGLGKLGTQLNLNTETVGGIVVPVPPPAEVVKICEFLDRETAKIDTLIAKQTEFLTCLEEHHLAVVSEAVTQGLDASRPMTATGLLAFPRVPLHWSVRPLASLVRPGTLITYGIVQAGPDVAGGVPYIRTSDMGGASLPETGYMRTSREIAANYGRSRVDAGDVVIAIRATVGKALIVPDFLSGANLTQGTARIAPGPIVSAKYLQTVLNSLGALQAFDAISKGATFKEITLEMLRKFRVPVPPTEEQDAITEYLDAKLMTLDAARKAARHLIVCLRERRAALISAAVTGQIDITEPATAEAAA